MKTSHQILGMAVAALRLGGFSGLAADVVAKDKKPVRLPRCFVDKDGNGKCDKSVADGGKCKKNHGRQVAEQNGTVAPAAGTTGGAKTSFITCPGQGLCVVCGLCSHGKS